MYYKNFSAELGFSDCANLTLRFADNVEILEFGQDDEYRAWVIDQDISVPSHYHQVAEGANWLKVYDDEGLAAYFVADKIRVYRAGEMGCLIQLDNCIKDTTGHCGSVLPFMFY